MFTYLLLLLGTLVSSKLSVIPFLESSFCVQGGEYAEDTCDFPTYGSDDCTRKGMEEIGTSKMTFRNNGFAPCISQEFTNGGTGGLVCGQGINELQQCILDFHDKVDIRDKKIALVYVYAQMDYVVWLKDDKNPNNEQFCIPTDQTKPEILDSKQFWSYLKDICDEEKQKIDYCSKNDCSDLVY